MTSNQNMRTKYPEDKYPFSDELCNFMDQHPEFHDSLKLANPKRFKFIPVIILSHTPESHPLSSDQVIGLFYYDKKTRIFKQDYIVNKDQGHVEFISYSASQNDGDYVKPIESFFDDYGNKGPFYHRSDLACKWEHHYSSVESLPDVCDLRNLARRILKNSKK